MAILSPLISPGTAVWTGVEVGIDCFLPFVVGVAVMVGTTVGDGFDGLTVLVAIGGVDAIPVGVDERVGSGIVVAVGIRVGVFVGSGVAVGLGVGVLVGYGVAVGTDVGVGMNVGVGMSVGVGSGVAVGSGVGVFVGIGVGELVGVGVLVGMAVGVFVGSGVGVLVGRGVGVLVDVGVSVLVGVGVLVGSGVAVGTCVGVGVLVGVGVEVLVGMGVPVETGVGRGYVIRIAAFSMVKGSIDASVSTIWADATLMVKFVSASDCEEGEIGIWRRSNEPDGGLFRFSSDKPAMREMTPVELARSGVDNTMTFPSREVGWSRLLILTMFGLKKISNRTNPIW